MENDGLRLVFWLIVVSIVVVVSIATIDVLQKNDMANKGYVYYQGYIPVTVFHNQEGIPCSKQVKKYGAAHYITKSFTRKGVRNENNEKRICFQ